MIYRISGIEVICLLCLSKIESFDNPIINLPKTEPFDNHEGQSWLIEFSVSFQIIAFSNMSFDDPETDDLSGLPFAESTDYRIFWMLSLLVMESSDNWVVRISSFTPIESTDNTGTNNFFLSKFESSVNWVYR